MNERPIALAGLVSVVLLAVAPTAASAQDGGGGSGGDQPATEPAPPEPEPKPVEIRLKLNGLRGGDALVGERIEVVGKVRPFVPRQRVEVKLGNRGDTVAKSNPYVRQVKGRNFGRFKLRSKPLVEAGKYRARATKPATEAQKGARAKSRSFGLRFPDLDPGDRGPAVELFNKLLRKRGYFNTDNHTYSAHTERAVMAFRKVNGMSRTFQATPEIFRILAFGKGGFPVKYEGAGKHVEIDISRQVMALVGGEKKYVFHIATGAAATPSDHGHFTFYRKDPGFNSLGMYYSVYYNRGEAIHGYHSVPPYPASHGCIRNPIPDSVWIYNWVDLGDPIYVYE